jgi:hypothetical protein
MERKKAAGQRNQRVTPHKCAQVALGSAASTTSVSCANYTEKKEQRAKMQESRSEDASVLILGS